MQIQDDRHKVVVDVGVMLCKSNRWLSENFHSRVAEDVQQMKVNEHQRAPLQYFSALASLLAKGKNNFQHTRILEDFLV